MTYQDKEIQCSECHTTFGFSAEEQSFYADKGLGHEPRRCKPCRSNRKARSQEGPQGQSRGGDPGRNQNRPHGQSRGGYKGRNQGHPARAGAEASERGVFVRSSRQNSHGRHEDGPWVQGGGLYQPRHGHKTGGRGGWQRRQDESNFRSPSQRQDSARRGADTTPLFKADFGPVEDVRHERDHRGSRHQRPEHGARGARGQGFARRSGGRDHGQRPEAGAQERPKPRAKVLYDAVCTDCDSATQVPFKPNTSMPVYCRLCLRRHKGQKQPVRRTESGGRRPKRA